MIDHVRWPQAIAAFILLGVVLMARGCSDNDGTFKPAFARVSHAAQN